jgi:hypothetical protein
VAVAALGAALLSLGLNAALLWRLRHPERLAAPAVERALERLVAQDARVPYEVRIPAGTPVHFDIPVDHHARIRLNTTFPIDTEITVPLRTPFGTHDVRLPIRTTVPVRTDLPVHLRDTFILRTETQTEIAVPLELRVRDLPLDAIRDALRP